MQVTCPGCQSRFKLPEGVQPGARLRCSVCGTIFALPGDAEAQEQAVPAPAGASAA
ncbi:MAG: zinc-ribbon domain-containing protein, partial [Desulfovibrio sp.]|nr:zinc-ribbon domain-containing protein [Desulfovibrio sp.]